MPLPESNPLHIYRICLRECGYLPLPRCRSYMREITIKKFRKYIPRHSPGRGEKRNAPELPDEKIRQLHKFARHHAAVLRHAAEGYLPPLERVVRLSYGRLGRGKYDLLDKFLYPSGEAAESMRVELDEEDEEHALEGFGNDAEVKSWQEQVNNEETGEHATVKDTLYPSLSPTVGASSTAFTTFYTDNRGREPQLEPNPPKWKLDLPPRLQALLVSQSNEQSQFMRPASGQSPQVKLKFNPPTQTIWRKPLPYTQYRNKRMAWYQKNMKAALPPLATDAEYWALHDLVTGKQEMPPLIPRRAAPQKTAEDVFQGYIEAQSELILEGPKFGPRRKDALKGRPHELTPWLLQKMLSRVVLSQTPLVKVANPGQRTEADSGLVFLWDDGITSNKVDKWKKETEEPLGKKALDLLFA